MEKCLQSVGWWSEDRNFITSLTELLMVTIATYLKYPLQSQLPGVSQVSSFPKTGVKACESDTNPT